MCINFGRNKSKMNEIHSLFDTYKRHISSKRARCWQQQHLSIRKSRANLESQVLALVLYIALAVARIHVECTIKWLNAFCENGDHPIEQIYSNMECICVCVFVCEYLWVWRAKIKEKESMRTFGDVSEVIEVARLQTTWYFFAWMSLKAGSWVEIWAILALLHCIPFHFSIKSVYCVCYFVFKCKSFTSL